MEKSSNLEGVKLVNYSSKMPEQIQRQTAYKVWISNLNSSNFIRSEGEFTPNYIKIKDKNVSRINLIGTVIRKYENEDKTYSALVIDDSSAQIRVKTWRENTSILDNLNEADTALVIGRLREYSSEIYITPEIVKKLNANWELLRKLELLKEHGKPEFKIIEDEEKKKGIMEEQIDVKEIKIGTSSAIRQEILELIEKTESEEGINFNNIKETLDYKEQEIEEILQELLKEGEIYQISDKYRLLK